MPRATTKYVGPDSPAVSMPDGHRLALRSFNAKQRKAAIKRYPQLAKYWILTETKGEEE